MCDYCKAASKCIRGDYGNGNERKKKLESEGFCYRCVQNLVNYKLGNSFRYSHEDYGHCFQGYCDDAIEILSN